MQNKGFTLLELSIVIVIIGLIVAGISAGQSLVRQAQLREVVSDVQKYRMAYNSFKLQYDGVAGDINNASAYWPSATNIADGDNDGRFSGGVMSSSENLQFFYQLMLAGLIDGTYEGIAVPYPQRGISHPISDYHPRAFFWGYGGTIWGHYTAGNSLVLSYEWNTNPSTPIVAVRDAQAIDAKNDDGSPYTGLILSYSHTNGQCAAIRPASLSPPVSTKYNQTYQVTTESNVCNMHFAFSDYSFK